MPTVFREHVLHVKILSRIIDSRVLTTRRFATGVEIANLALLRRDGGPLEEKVSRNGTFLIFSTM